MTGMGSPEPEGHGSEAGGAGAGVEGHTESADAGWPDEAIHPPSRLLVLAGAAALGAWVLVPAPWPAVRLLGWALGSLLVMSLVTAYTLADGDRRRTPGYVPLRRARWLRAAVVVFGLAAATLNAFAYATEVAS